MAQTLAAFVTDSGFLVPSLVAARQLVKQKIHELADIVIYTVDVDGKVIQSLVKHPANEHIRFEPLESKNFLPPEGVNFRKYYVPLASLARLCLQEVITPPRRYDNVIYIDGDVQIVGDVSALIKYRVPDGILMAGRDSAWFVDNGYNIASDDYLLKLGNISRDRYFNAGILAFRLETWREMAPKALQFAFANPETCIYYDQCALNATFKDRVLFFSPRYNFISDYAELYVQRRYPPSIIHFKGPNKPWQYRGMPWGGQFYRNYLDLIRELPMLEGYLKIAPHGGFMRGAKNIARPAWVRMQEARRLAKIRDITKSRRAQFFDYVQNTKFPI